MSAFDTEGVVMKSYQKGHTKGYDQGYEDGYEDAFTERTAEAMALVRVFWRKLSDARAERDQWRKVALTDAPHRAAIFDAELEHTIELERENRAYERLVEDLRAEIVRLQQASSAHILVTNPYPPYGTYTATHTIAKPIPEES